ncbi:MAG: hypothetical protein SFW62_06325 [Alphaproteobacteria bacterium]|nr:hypothetical protein [Alphaproteobacteria bacterium]
MSNASPKPKMDVTEEQARTLIGKYMLVGIAHCDSSGAVVSREQIHGIVDRANLKEGVVIKLKGSNEERAVPLKLADLQIARLGEYRLNETGEVVEDPDYTLKVTIAG